MSIGKWRLLIALLMLCLFVSVFLAPGVWTGTQGKALLSTQLSPHITHTGIGLFIALAYLIATALLGRFYCSLLCPAGLIQELFHRIGGLLKRRRLRYTRKSYPIALLSTAAIATVFGFMTVANFLDPLGLFGRLFTIIFSPALDTALTGILVLGIVLLIIVPLFKGRWFCDRLCPVGALLGLAASAGKRGVVWEAEKCVSCGRCEKICPVRTANAAGRTIDPSRCVLCLDCVEKCPVGALSYRRREQKERRSFLQTAGAAVAGGLFVLARPLTAGLGFASSGKPNIVPPGSRAYNQHRARCVSCQSCVLACPVGIIRLRKDDLRPVLDYDRGYCQYGCTACTDSCPAGALSPLTLETKQRTRLAKTKLDYDRCVTIVSGQACGACAEVCPTHAVRMVEQGLGYPTAPDFDAAYCIGCGACYHVCPTEPRAFVLEGLHAHEETMGVRPGGHADVENKRLHMDEEGELPEFPF